MTLWTLEVKEILYDSYHIHFTSLWTLEVKEIFVDTAEFGKRSGIFGL